MKRNSPFLLQKHPVFTGAVYTQSIGIHHFKSLKTYRLSKRHSFDEDGDMRTSNQNRMIVYRLDEEFEKQTNNFSDMLSSSFKIKRGVVKEIPQSDVLCNNTDITSLTPFGTSSLKTTKLVNDGCPRTKKVLYMGVVSDCTYTANYGTPEQTLREIISNWNLVTHVFESSFNIIISISAVKIFQVCSAAGKGSELPWNTYCSSGYDLASRLSDFSLWRTLKTPDTLGLWHLLTKCKFVIPTDCFLTL